MDNQNLRTEQTAALAQALDLLDEVLKRLICRDSRTAILLIHDARSRIVEAAGVRDRPNLEARASLARYEAAGQEEAPEDDLIEAKAVMQETPLRPQ
jgi:hypothetical protein